MNPYESAAESALAALREWARGKILPKSVDELPKDCPLYSAGLSYFQASWCLAKLRGETPAAGAPEGAQISIRQIAVSYPGEQGSAVYGLADDGQLFVWNFEHRRWDPAHGPKLKADYAAANAGG